MSDGSSELTEEPAAVHGAATSVPVGLRRVLVGTALVAVIVVAWILAIPPSAGPDEPAHVVRGAALVRGQLEGLSPQVPGPARAYELPAWVGYPDPVCYAFMPFAPASCLADQSRPEGDALIDTRSWNYPVWGHLLPGLGTLSPASVSGYAARALDAAVPIVAIGAALALALSRSRVMLGATLLAVTPMAWFMFAVVNPSGLVVAGGVGLWVGLGAVLRDRTLLARWLVGLSWAMMALPRRDGLFWAVLVASIVVLLDDRSPLDIARSLGRGPVVLLAASTLVTLAWAFVSDANSERLLLAAPLVPILAEGIRRLWRARALDGTVRRGLAIGGAVAAAAVVAYLIMDQRAGGFDRDVMRIVVGRTGIHLDEAIGVLGWLDTPIPDTLVFVWLLALGVLVGAALIVDDRRLLAAAGATVAIGVIASWVLEMAQSDPTGTYWQGRYYLPFLVGIPIVLGRIELPAGVAARIGSATIIVALVVANVALAAAIRRWAVGLAGPMTPWSWNTYDAPLSPLLLLAAHLAASVGLWWWAVGPVRARRAAGLGRSGAPSAPQLG